MRSYVCEDDANGRATCSEDLHGLDGSKPCVGLMFDSIEKAWEMWENYAKTMGFGVRKRCHHKSHKDGIVTDAMFVCNKEGHKRLDKSRVNSRRRPETRTGCLVKLYVVYDRTCRKYKVKDFIDVHNHGIGTFDPIHMFRSHIHVTDAPRCAISDATNDASRCAISVATNDARGCAISTATNDAPGCAISVATNDAPRCTISDATNDALGCTISVATNDAPGCAISTATNDAPRCAILVATNDAPGCAISVATDADDASQWVTTMASMALRAILHVASSTEARLKVTDFITDMCNKIYAMPLNESGSQVHAKGFGDAHDVVEGLVRRTGKRKTKSYKSKMELRGGMGRRQNVARQLSNLGPKGRGGPPMLLSQANDYENRHMCTAYNLNQVSGEENLEFDYHTEIDHNTFGWQGGTFGATSSPGSSHREESSLPTSGLPILDKEKHNKHREFNQA